MKNYLRLCVKILAVMFVFLMGLSTAGAVETECVDYDALFSRVDTADGIFADMLSTELVDAFEADPKGFLAALVNETESRQEKVSYLIMYNLSYDSNVELESVILELRDTNPEYGEILDKIITDLDDSRANDGAGNVGTAPILGQTPFDPETIRGFIDGNLELRNTDESFYEVISNAYMMSPALFARTIADLPEKDIAYLGKAISYSLSLTKRTPLFVTLDKSDTGYIANILLQRELRVDSVTLSDLKEINKEARKAYLSSSAKAVCERSLLPPTIGTMTYTSGQLVAGDYENLKITFSETTATMSSRSYWVEVYRTVGSTRQLLSERTVIIPPGNSSLDFNFSIEFSTTGSFYTYVKVYSEENGALLASRTGTYPDAVYGKWKVRVTLPQDRSEPGILKLYNATGTCLMETICLGQSVSNDEPWVYLGNTPTGTYTGYLYGPMSDTDAYGPYKVVATDIVSGAVAEYGTRSGIWIHGGRDEYYQSTGELAPTNGCVRITNTYQLELQTKISNLINNSYHLSTGMVYITEEN